MSGSLLNWTSWRDLRPRNKTGGRRAIPYTLGSDGLFDWDEFKRPENLMVAYQILKRDGGHAPGIDRLRFKYLSPAEVYAGLRSVSDALHSGKYRPLPTRDVDFTKPSGKIRTLSLPAILDRTVAKAFDICLRSYFVGIYPDLHRSPGNIFAEMEKHILTTGETYLIESDITDCFPSFQIDDVIESFQEHLQDPFLLRGIEQVVRGYEGLGKTTGLAQGNPLSPLAADITLRRILRPVREGRRGNHPFWRYVDNFVGVSQNAHEGHHLQSRLVEHLGPHGLSLEQKAETNLRNRHGKPVTILGLSPIWTGQDLRWATPTKTWREMDERIEGCWDTDKPHEVCGSLLKGVTSSLAPTLVPAAREETVSRLLNLAMESSLHPPSRQELLARCQNAWDGWLRLKETVLREQQLCLPTIGRQEVHGCKGRDLCAAAPPRL